ncbi:MAG: DUF1641 domain-containing protein [Pseudomonadota bacterium]
MTNEELILKKLEDLEAKIDPIVKSRESFMELKEDLLPLQHQAIQLIIRELQEVEAGFQLDDVLLLIKQAMRSMRNFVFAMKIMDNVVEFITDMEPLLKSAVPKIIESLDEMERQGVFRILKATLNLRSKIATQYDSEDIEKIGDGMVAMLGLAKKMADPKALAFLEKVAALPGNVDLSKSREIGPLGLISAGFNSELKQGLGVLMELTKAMGKMKDNGHRVSPAPIATPHTHG